MLKQINIIITVEREKVIENQNRNKTRIGSNEKKTEILILKNTTIEVKQI